MAGRDKTTAWENVKWIRAHLPLWEKKGMSKGFLNSIISPKYKGCELDVGSAITCDLENFETLYNQKDFLVELKAICKKYCMPYGKVDKQYEETAEREANYVFASYFANKKIREDRGRVKRPDFEEKFRDYKIENKIENVGDLLKILVERQQESIRRNNKRTGIACYSWDSLLVELYIDFIEKGFTTAKMAEMLGEKETTTKKYVAELLASGIIKSPLGKKDKYIANEEIVKFAGGRKRAVFEPDWGWE